MPTLSFIDMESGTDNSITDALQVDESSCSDRHVAILAPCLVFAAIFFV